MAPRQRFQWCSSTNHALQYLCQYHPPARQVVQLVLLQQQLPPQPRKLPQQQPYKLRWNPSVLSRQKKRLAATSCSFQQYLLPPCLPTGPLQHMQLQAGLPAHFSCTCPALQESLCWGSSVLEVAAVVRSSSGQGNSSLAGCICLLLLLQL